jgi:hypothetical protein
MVKPHSILPPSASDKWMTCFGWYAATKGLPNKTSKYAEEGTHAHEMLEATLRLGVRPEEIVADSDLALNLSIVTTWLRKYLKAHPGSDFHIERWVSWGSAIGSPKLGGTIDLAIVNREELIVADYKHGSGIVVEVLDNRQLMLYLMGLVQLYGPRKKYRIMIFQPRARHEDGPIREYIVDDLEEFMLEVKHAVKENLKEGGGVRVAGDHCAPFCTAAGRCKTLTEYSLKAAGEEFLSADVDE